MNHDDIKKLGYDKEEEYFYELNRELIERKRRELDQKRKNKETQGRTSPYWMKCPKCGSEMKEVEFSRIKADQCSGCHGLYFDQEEFETLVEVKHHTGFFESIRKFFKS
jgi:hypothetical protein